MPCRQVSTYNGTTGSGKTGGGGFATEAECNQACQEGACCEGTTCTIKPQCQCQGTGKTFKGVGTTCTPNPCDSGKPCNCAQATPAPQSLTLTIQQAAFSLFTGTTGDLYYDELKTGGSCENDSAIVQWLNGTVIPLALFSSNPPANDFVGNATYSGVASTQGPFGSVEVGCWAVFTCSGDVSVEMFWCPAVSSGTACMAYTSRPFTMSGSGTQLCGFASKTLNVSQLFRQLRATQNTGLLDMSGVGLGTRTCLGNFGGAATQAVSRYFNGTVTISANQLP